MKNINGLGIVADDYSDQPWLGTGTEPSIPTTTTKPSVTDVIKNWFGVAKEGVEVYNTFKSGSEGSMTTTFNPPPPPPPANNTATILKYGLITAGAGLLAYGAYQVLKGKEKKGK